MSHKVTPSEIGMIRIYMKPSDKATDGPLRGDNYDGRLSGDYDGR